MLDPRRLLVFDAVLRAGSMSGAACELRYSPAAVSQQIACLESEAGIPLLRRLPRGVEPTAAGAVVARHARLLADRLAVASAEVETVARGQGGALRVASFPAASGALLPQSLFALTAEFPGLTVSVEDRTAPDALSDLRAGTLDLAVIADINHSEDLDFSGVEASELLHTILRVMLPVGHRFAREKVIPLANLLADRWIQTGDAICAPTLAQAALQLRTPPRITMHTTDIGATRGLVASGLGIALVSELLDLETPDARVVIRQVTPQPTHPVLVVTPSEPFVLPVARSLRDRLHLAHRPVRPAPADRRSEAHWPRRMQEVGRGGSLAVAIGEIAI